MLWSLLVGSLRNPLSSRISGEFFHIPLTDKSSVTLSIITACLSLPVVSKELQQEEDCKLMGFGPPPRRGLWLRRLSPRMGSLLCPPQLAAAPAPGAALWYFYSQNTAHRLQVPEPVPLHSSQLQSKSTFCTEHLDSPSSLFSYWAPTGFLQVNPACI